MEAWLATALDYATWFLASIPNWVPVLTSVVATGIAIAAFIRSGKPTKPKVWIEVIGRGHSGAMLKLFVENHTEWPVMLRSIEVVDGSGEIRPAQTKAQEPEAPFSKSIRLDAAVSPNGSFSSPIGIRLSDNSSWINPSMHLSISTMRRTVKNKGITVPIIIPPAAPIKSS